MAYMNQEKKNALAPAIKEVLKKHGAKATIGVRHYMTLVVKVKANEQLGLAESRTINPYWYQEHYKDNATTIAFLDDLFAACNGQFEGSAYTNHNRSDIQTDYFDVGWYVDVEIV